MARHKLHHPTVILIRNRYHLARRHKDWPEIKRLAADGRADEARALARAAVNSSPRLAALQAGSQEARARKKAWLRVQRDQEQEIRDALADLSSRLGRLLARAAGKDGTISPGRHVALLTAVKAENRAAYASVNRIFLRMLRSSAKTGLKAALQVAAVIVAKLKKSRAAAESDQISDEPRESSRAFAERSWNARALLDGKGREGKGNGYSSEPPNGGDSKPLLRHVFLTEDDEPDQGDDVGPDATLQKVDYAVRSTVFEKIFQGALKQTMEAGLFGETGVSSRVWDLRDQNLLVLKRLVAAGIANGESAGSISADIQDLLVQPAGFDESYSGPGIYKSAYKNALRLTRTETTRAYGAANALFAAEKEWTVIWHVSDGQREEDECDDLDGEEMAPDEFLAQYPQHPNCLCYSTFAVPDLPEDAPSSDDEPPPDEGDSGE